MADQIPAQRERRFIVEWSTEFSDGHRLVGLFSTLELAEANIPDGRWRIYEAEVNGGAPRVIAVAPGWDDSTGEEGS